MKAKHIFSIVMISLSLLFLTSCIDYVQSVSFDGESIYGYTRVTLSKTMTEWMDEEGDASINDYLGDELDDLPYDMDYNLVDTDLEEGFEFSFVIDNNDIPDEMEDYIPLFDKKMNRYEVPFLLGGSYTPELEESIKSEEDEMSEAMVMLMLSSVKCKVMIDKNIIGDFKYAYFEGVEEGTYYDIPYFDYGNGYCFEIPFIYLTSNLPYDFTRFYIEY